MRINNKYFTIETWNTHKIWKTQILWIIIKRFDIALSITRGPHTCSILGRVAERYQVDFCFMAKERK